MTGATPVRKLPGGADQPVRSYRRGRSAGCGERFVRDRAADPEAEHGAAVVDEIRVAVDGVVVQDQALAALRQRDEGVDGRDVERRAGGIRRDADDRDDQVTVAGLDATARIDRAAEAPEAAYQGAE